MYVWYRIAGGWDLGIHEYPFLNSLGTVLGDRSGMGGKMIRWTEYRMYTRSAVLTGVPKSTERPMVVVLDSVDAASTVIISHERR